MPSSHSLEAHLASPSSVRFSSSEARGQRRTPLWSNLRDVCELLEIIAPVSVDEDGLFQHIQFKPAQRVHARGQTFDTLYVLNSQ
jgi:hypothetical protein